MGTETQLGQRIREVRLAKKLTQNDVVGEYMTRNMLSKIENGSAAPSVKTLEYLAKALDVPVSYFLDDGGEGTVNAEQLHAIGEMAAEMAARGGGLELGWSLCIRARALLAAGKTGEAIKLFDNHDPEEWPDYLADHAYMVLEDCHRETGDYKQAYEYALKRLDNMH